MNQKGWRPCKSRQHAGLEDFMYKKKRKGISFSPHDLQFISGLQKLCCLVQYNDSPVTMCYMAISSKQLCTHHKHALVLLKNTRKKKEKLLSLLICGEEGEGL